VAGYSETPLATKLGIRSASTLVILGAPSGFALDLPPAVILRRRVRGPADVVVAFYLRAESLHGAMANLGQVVFPNGGLWIAWPKKASGRATDVTEYVVREAALELGLVDNKVCAIDETWSALRLVWRKENRQRRS
jgi:hypothetical protein